MAQRVDHYAMRLVAQKDLGGPVKIGNGLKTAKPQTFKHLITRAARNEAEVAHHDWRGLVSWNNRFVIVAIFKEAKCALNKIVVVFIGGSLKIDFFKVNFIVVFLANLQRDEVLAPVLLVDNEAENPLIRWKVLA